LQPYIHRIECDILASAPEGILKSEDDWRKALKAVLFPARILAVEQVDKELWQKVSR